ncbi:MULTISPECIES: hypothetical protein [Amycolatopsis]|uniref:TIR domain-containing protein n=1 Tax=Amycolatopsis albidoflavus TaxID=102226 RepID=A0ABW5I6B0_9PSEU
MIAWADLVPQYENSSDDALHTALGAALLGEGLGVSPTDRARLGRFAKSWLANKGDEMIQRIKATDTYRIWAETAGPGQLAENGVLAGALHEQGSDDRVAAVLGEALARDTAAKHTRSYDVAVSFTDEVGEYVRSVVEAARTLGLVVFFEPDMTFEWWGRNFLVEGRKVYGQRAWHFVPFLSPAYLAAAHARDAFATAIEAATRRNDDYVLPVLVDQSEVPAELLNPATGFLRTKDHTPAELAAHLLAKVRRTKADDTAARDFGTAVRNSGTGT